mgnify:FL=1
MSLGDRSAGVLALGRSTDTTTCWNSRPIHDRARSADSANRKAVTRSAPATPRAAFRTLAECVSEASGASVRPRSGCFGILQLG